MTTSVDCQFYRDLVDFIGESLGDNVEVVLHDFADIEHSVVAIKNGHVTGRQVGAPLTLFARHQLLESRTSGTTRMMNYRGQAKNGKQLRSSSLFLRDHVGEVIGMLCVNIDVSEYQRAADALAKLAAIVDPVLSDEGSVRGSQEHFPSSIKDLVQESLDDILDNELTDVERLSAEERIAIVAELRKKDIFQIKGAVSEVADYLQVSEATIYRYLTTIARRESKAG